MVRRLVWLGLLCGCMQDFSVFDPDGAAPPSDGSSETGLDAGLDAPKVDAGQDGTAQDAPADIGPADVKPDVIACTETGAITYGGHCYFLVTTTQTQTAAATGCTNVGAHLVTITDANEQAAVIALGTNTERWNDLFRTNGPPKDGNYKWLTGESRNGFSAWSPGEPNGSGQCARLLAAGLWADEDCTTPHASICERE